MKKFFKVKIQWHIAVILIVILVISLASWFLFAKSMGATLLYYLEKDNSDIQDPVIVETISETVSAVADGSEQDNGLFSRLCAKLDYGLDTIDTIWPVFMKSAMVKADSIFTYYVLGEIQSIQVLEGKDNWLFYKSTNDGDPIADYEGTNLYSAEEMKNTLDAIVYTQSQLESKGIELAILIAPNKENIYSEFMPDTYSHSEVSATDIMIDYLYNNGVNIISPKENLLSAHLDTDVYYRYDTHWNKLGGYIGVRDTLASWGIDIPELSERDITTKNLRDDYHYCTNCDLAEMVGLMSVFNDEIEYEIKDTVAVDWDKFEAEYNMEELSHFSNDDAEIQANLLLVGDSFRAAMIPSLSEIFSDLYVVHKLHYTPEILDIAEPDYIIAEYVERYSSELSSIDFLVNQFSIYTY